MHSIDMFLLNKFQDVSDWFQEWFGITNFTIARVCFVIGICLTLIVRWILFITAREEKDSTDIFIDIFAISMDVFFLMAILGTIKVIKNEEEKCLKNPQYLNLLAVHYFWIRVICCFFLFMAFMPGSQEIQADDFFVVMYGVFERIRMVVFFLAFYFASCTPKPYKPSKVKKWFKSFVESVQATVDGVFSPTPELATVRIAKNRRVVQRPILATGSAFYFIYRYDILLA